MMVLKDFAMEASRCKDYPDLGKMLLKLQNVKFPTIYVVVYDLVLNNHLLSLPVNVFCVEVQQSTESFFQIFQWPLPYPPVALASHLSTVDYSLNIRRLAIC